MTEHYISPEARRDLLKAFGKLSNLVHGMTTAPRVEVDDIIDLPPSTAQDLRKRMFALMNEIGITDREVAIECIGLIIARTIGSRTELGPRDWARMVQAIEDWKIIDSFTPGIEGVHR